MIFFPNSVRLILLLLIVAHLVTGCATTTDTTAHAESLIVAGQYEAGLQSLEVLASKGPENKEAKLVLLRNRNTVMQRLLNDAKVAIDAGQLDVADGIYARLLAIDPNNSLAKMDRERIYDLRQRQTRFNRADELFRGGDMEGAERILQTILLEEPTHAKSLDLIRKITARQAKDTALTPVLGPEFKKIISLEFRDSSLKDVFDAIWHASGINFILDRDIRSETKATIFVHDVTIEEAIDALLMTQQLAKKTVNAKSLFIYQKTPQKISEYQDLVVRNFFLAYADAKQIQTMLKTILKIKEVYVDEKRNLLVVRDNQEAVDMAEKLIQAHDQAEPEVMLALDVIEIKHSKLSELGLASPTQVTLGVLPPVTLTALKQLNSSGISVGFNGLPGSATAAINLKNTDGDTNMLANPRIRVRNREKAKIHIGDRLPIVTTTPATTVYPGAQNVTYLDVGLMLEVEPQVMLDGDVVIKINLEVSTATQSTVNPLFYDVGTRKANTVLTIRDGETQVLAGLIRDDERQSGSHLPGLGDIPILGRLFSSELHSRDKTEIILAITPVVLHNLMRPNAALMEFSSGTDTGQKGSLGAGVASSGQQQPATIQRFPGVVQPNMPVANAPAVAAPPVANAPQATGVIPMADFQGPPGVGMPAAPPVP